MKLPAWAAGPKAKATLHFLGGMALFTAGATHYSDGLGPELLAAGGAVMAGSATELLPPAMVKPAVAEAEKIATEAAGAVP